MAATVEEEEDGNATLGRGKVIHRTQTEPGREREEGGIWDSTNTHARNICDFTIIKSILH